MNVDMTEMAPGPNQADLNHLGEEQEQPPCKQPGCDQPSLTTYGPYGRLCAEHKAAVQSARAAKRTRPVRKVQRPASADGTVAAVLNELRGELAATHERVDRLTKAIAALERLEVS